MTLILFYTKIPLGQEKVQILNSVRQECQKTEECTTRSRPEIKDPKIILEMEPHRETKPKAEAWEDPTYSEMLQKQPFKGQKGRLMAMFLTF